MAPGGNGPSFDGRQAIMKLQLGLHLHRAHLILSLSDLK